MTRLFKRTLFFSACISVLLSIFTTAFAQQERERSAKKARDAASQSAKAARVFDQIMGTRERSIPLDLLDRAEAVAVFPGVIKAGFMVGARPHFSIWPGEVSVCRLAPRPRILFSCL